MLYSRFVAIWIHLCCYLLGNLCRPQEKTVIMVIVKHVAIVAAALLGGSHALNETFPVPLMVNLASTETVVGGLYWPYNVGPRAGNYTSLISTYV
jgi:hypothetical protein